MRLIVIVTKGMQKLLLMKSIDGSVDDDDDDELSLWKHLKCQET